MTYIDVVKSLGMQKQAGVKDFFKLLLDDVRYGNGLGNKARLLRWHTAYGARPAWNAIKGAAGTAWNGIKTHPKTTAAIGGTVALGGGATAYALTRNGEVVPVAPEAPAPADALQKLLDFTKANKGALVGGATGTMVGGTTGYLGAKALDADKSTQLLATLLSAAALGTGGAIAGHYGYDKNQA